MGGVSGVDAGMNVEVRAELLPPPQGAPASAAGEGWGGGR